MASFKEVVTHPVTISVFGLIVLSCLIWFVGPEIKFGEGNTAPLASPVTRLLLVMGILLAWGANNLRLQFKSKQQSEGLINSLEENQSLDSEQADEEVSALSGRFSNALDTLKTAKFAGSGKGIYELPWYIIVGPPGSGKTTALINSGLEFPLADKFGKGALQGVGGTRNCDWWFTNSAVMIDTAGRYTTQDSHKVIDSKAWTGFLDLLKQHRRRRPINGAIVAISLQDLLTQTEDERAAHAKTIRRRIEELMEQLEIRFPIYLMFTKVDMVSGFREFFDGFGREDREQVWGVTLPDATTETQSPDFEFIDDGFKSIVERLYSKVVSGVQSEHNIDRRAAVFGFPQQMESAKDIAMSFIKETFGSNRYTWQPYLRGAYFSSGNQEGMPIDRLMNSVSSNFGFSPDVVNNQNNEGKSYFLDRLFKEVIIPEAELVGLNKRYEAARLWLRRGGFVGIAAVSALTISVWATNFVQNRSAINDVSELHSQFENNKSRALSARKGPIDTVPALNALNESRQVFDSGTAKLLSGLGMYDGDVDRESAAAYKNQLKVILLPQLVKMLENEVKATFSDGDLYGAFRMYMMFGRVDKMEKELLTEWFTTRFEYQYRGKAETRDQLIYHLEQLMAQTFNDQSLDDQLVYQAQSKLLQVTPAERVYRGIKTNPTYAREVNLISDLGESVSELFVVDDQVRESLLIPYLFTIEGYDALDISSNLSLLNDIINDRWMFEGSGVRSIEDYSQKDLVTLSQQLKALYFADYIRVWRKVIHAFKVEQFQSIDQANSALVSLVDPIYSPVVNVLQITSENTELTPAIGAAEDLEGAKNGTLKKIGKFSRLASDKRPKTAVDKTFSELHALTGQNRNGRVGTDIWLERIGAVQVYLAEIAMAPDAGLKAFQVVSQRYSSGTNNPIAALKNYAKNAPAPLENWLIDIANQSWKVVMTTAKTHVNAQWKEQVYSQYKFSLAGRYPLNSETKDELALYDFVEFFKPGGTLSSFADNYIAPFVTSGSKWNNRTIDGYSLGFNTGSLKRIQDGLKITEVYFRENPDSPSVQLDLKPASMHEKDLKFILDIGEQRIQYSHGPKFWKKVNWVGDEDRKRIRVSMETVNGSLYEQAYYGPWAWFRLMDDSKVKTTSRANVYRVMFEVSQSTGGQSRRIIYEAKTKSANSPFDTRLFSKFRAPERL